MTNLTSVDSHFPFGENWSEYAKHIDEARIEEAKKGLLRFLQLEEIQNKTFLDIGCGSGLHALAALKLGAESVVATDIDPVSVATTIDVLGKNAPSSSYEVREISVFDLPKQIHTPFDVVYSWGVLHHTGDMYRAITIASSLVAPGGILALALYRRTLMCKLWRYIKRWYTNSSKQNQKRVQSVYIFLLKLRYALLRRDFEAMRTNYLSSRGMSFEHDVHDWLGGYPYESVTPEEVYQHMERLGFTLVRQNVTPGGIGLFGSGCDEFVFRK
jgi:2-polyprenyl-6-hydroxyphenyl methylase/3-demethylubiquinone-9 3-methyltransferase